MVLWPFSRTKTLHRYVPLLYNLMANAAAMFDQAG